MSSVTSKSKGGRATKRLRACDLEIAAIVNQLPARRVTALARDWEDMLPHIPEIPDTASRLLWSQHDDIACIIPLLAVLHRRDVHRIRCSILEATLRGQFDGDGEQQDFRFVSVPTDSPRSRLLKRIADRISKWPLSALSSCLEALAELDPEVCDGDDDDGDDDGYDGWLEPARPPRRC